MGRVWVGDHDDNDDHDYDHGDDDGYISEGSALDVWAGYGWVANPRQA